MRHAYIPFGYYTMIVDEPPLALRRPGQAFGLPNHYTMIVGVPPLAFRRPGQAFGLPNHYTMIVGVPPLALRRPGQAFGLPNHYTTLRAAGYTGNVKFALPHALPQARIC